jgi:hypothetical protein
MLLIDHIVVLFIYFSFHSELKKYIGNENYCLLVDITQLDSAAGVPRADIYAPYLCRYRLFSKQDVTECFRDKGYKRLLFHGDSMVRAIYGE